MTTYPTHQRAELVSQAALDDLFTDAQNWRDLLAQLDNRGFDNMTLNDILDVFPDFRAMAGLKSDSQPTAAKAPDGPQGTRTAFLDAFLTPDPEHPNQKPPTRNHGPDAIVLEKITRLRSALGPVTICYTTDDQIAFAFEHLHQLHRLKLTDLLADLIAHLTTKRATTIMPPRPERIM
jgi:hypothetical protein